MSLTADTSKNNSFWQNADKPFFPALSSNLSVDVCVIGAGIAGLSIAYRLVKEGRNVVVIDRERLAVGETGVSSAHLSNVLGKHYVNLRLLHGDEGAKLARESHGWGVDEIERIAHEEGIDCDFRRENGYLFLGPKTEEKFLRDELEASKVAGFTDVELLPNESFGPFEMGPCLKYGQQAQFHPVKYIVGLAQAVERHGGRIFMHAAAVQIEGGKPARVTTSQGYQITANHLVVATNVPINDRVTMQTKLAAYRSYLIAMRVPKDSIPTKLLWDTAEPYHYIRIIPETDSWDLVLVGGEDHRVGQDVHPEDHYVRLEDWARGRMGLDAKVAYRWSGQIIESIDSLAYIGRNPGDTDNVYIVAGDNGHGLTHGTIAGRIVTDLIAGRDNPWASLYNPSRLNFRGVGTYIRENLSTATQYGDWLSKGDVEYMDEVAPGEGAVVRDGLRKIACYRDTRGMLHIMSATCPHLGGVVRWNSAEKTWDCPCHGSRFEAKGDVLNGPAMTGLSPVMDPREREMERESPTVSI